MFADSALVAVFVATLVYFVAIIYFAPWRPRSLAEFFHHDDAGLNITTLVAASVTSGGVGYLLIGGHTNGLIMAIAPLALIAGYRLLGLFTAMLPKSFFEAGNFFAAAKTEIERQRGKASILPWTTSLPLILVYTLLMAFELFTASQLLAGIMSSEASLALQIFIAVAIFAATLFYSYLAGIRAVFRADRLQFYVILVFVAGLCVAAAVSIANPRNATTLNVASLIKWDGQTLANLALAMLAALNTQFYSVINFGCISHLPDDTRRSRVLNQSAIIMAILFALMIVVGAVTPQNWSAGLDKGMAEMVAPLGADWVGFVFLVVAVVGLTSVTASTVDVLQITLTQFLFDNVLDINTKDSRESVAAVNKARKMMVIIMTIAFIALATMHFARPNLFYLLLAIASPAETLVPLVVLIGFLSRIESGLTLLTNGVFGVFVAIFASALIFNLYSAAVAPLSVPLISLTHLSVSAAFAILIYLRARSQKKMRAAHEPGN